MKAFSIEAKGLPGIGKSSEVDRKITLTVTVKLLSREGKLNAPGMTMFDCRVIT